MSYSIEEDVRRAFNFYDYRRTKLWVVVVRRVSVLLLLEWKALMYSSSCRATCCYRIGTSALASDKPQHTPAAPPPKTSISALLFASSASPEICKSYEGPASHTATCALCIYALHTRTLRRRQTHATPKNYIYFLSPTTSFRLSSTFDYTIWRAREKSCSVWIRKQVFSLSCECGNGVFKK